MENLKLYNQLKSVPAEFLKTIQAGRLKGMSDIKPQWRINKLTEIFGPCGIGWKIQNLKFSYETVGQEVVCNCYLEFLFKYNGEWSEPIPGIGGSKIAAMESKGLYVSDEAEKMAYTDAISVASKMIGLASDIYMGYGGKYDNASDNHNPQGNSYAPSPEKWLNIANKQGVQTPEWTNVLQGIQSGKINSVADVRNHYKVNKDVASQLEQILNQKKNG